MNLLLVKKAMTDITKLFIKKMKDIFDYPDFVTGMMALTKTDEYCQRAIDFINSHDDIDVEKIGVFLI